MGIVLTSSAIGSLVGCTKETEKVVTVTQDKVVEKLVVPTNQKMNAEELTTAAEQLFNPYTFMIADKLLDQALNQDPTNEKALLLKKLNARLMTFKGIANRITGLAKKYGHNSGQDFEDWKKKFPASPLKTFLLDGPQDINSYEDAQTFLVSYREALNDFRVFAKTNPNLEITLNINPLAFKEKIDQNIAKSCTVQEHDGQQVVECDLLHVAEAKVNIADLIILGQEAAGEVLFMTMYTSYSFKGLEVLQNMPNQSEQAIHQALRAIPGALDLRKDNSMSVVKQLGSDLSVAAKWAIQYQKQLCSTGSTAGVNRRGYLFDQGICVGNIDEATRSLALLDQMLSGIISVALRNNYTQKDDSVRVDYMAFFNTPTSSLLNVLEGDTYSNCGKVKTRKDKSFGGIFVDQNADLYTTDPTCN